MSKFELYFPLKPWNLLQGWGTNGKWYQANGINILGHNGLDAVASNGQAVRAAHDGEVVYAGVDSKEGWGVVVRTIEPFDYPVINETGVYFKTIYWHLIKEIPVKVGQKVKVGDLIGYADNTGFSTGTHLHFGLKPQVKGENDWTWANIENQNGYLGAIDPTLYFNNYYAEDSQKVVAILQAMIEIYKQILLKLKNDLRFYKLAPR